MTGDADKSGTGRSSHDHSGGSHSSEPIPRTDPHDLHDAVDELGMALHAYVDTAVGVRAEFGASEADEDPRVLALENQVAVLNARLYDLLHQRLGMHSELTGMVWEDPPGTGADRDTDEEDTDEFHLGFVVTLPAGPSDQSIAAVLGIVDNGGAEIVERLLDSGFSVEGWGAARGGPVSFDDGKDGDDE